MRGRRLARILDACLRAGVVLILFQTLYFKFTGAQESVHIFSTLHMEPWGRIASGVAELIACLLLVLPRTAVLGALIALGVIAGAIVSHLTVLGIEVLDDGGLLFALAVVVFVACLTILWLRRSEIPFLGAAAAPAGDSEPGAGGL